MLPNNPSANEGKKALARYPLKRSNSLTLALPTSLVADVPHLREKTQKIGLIGRAAAIFRVDNIILFRDEKQFRAREQALVKRVLDYMATPQYLRRSLFEVSPELRFVGILPPLRTPNHPLGKSSKTLSTNEYREGIVKATRGTVSLVDIGVERLAMVPVLLPTGSRVNLRIESVNGDIVGRVVSWKDIPYYWGYSVKAAPQTLSEIIRLNRFDLAIATSKYGKPIASIRDSLKSRWEKARRTVITFGAPNRGLYEILREEGIDVEDTFDIVINTVGDQGTETLRCEEAVLASLAVLNFTAES